MSGHASGAAARTAVPTVASGRRTMGRLGHLVAVVALVAATVAGCAGPSGADGIDLSFRQYTLGNGLKVILRKDERQPKVAVDLWYHVGPANETAGRTGFAHLFEHMMFQGSGHIPVGEADKLLEAAGETDANANTHLDYTNFYETVPPGALELALWRESDQMGFLLDTLDQTRLSNQQSVVRNERRQTREQPPYALTNEVVAQLLYPDGHPYRASIMGSHTDIQAARLDEVRRFFSTYYVPNNATLAIVGDIDTAATKALVEKYFGSIPRGADVAAPRAVTPPLTAEKRRVVTDEVTLPAVTMSWLTPPVYTPGNAEGDMVAQVLTGTKYSRLNDALVLRSRIAQSVTVGQDSERQTSTFTVTAVANPGHTAEELETAIQRELDGLAASGPTQDELDAARTRLRSALLFSLEDVHNVAERLNYYDFYLGDADDMDRDLRQYDDIRPEDVRRFVLDQLPKDRRVVVYTVPGPKELPPDPPAPPDPPETAPVPRPASAEPWRDTPPRPGPTPPLVLPDTQRFELANGLPVYLVESHGLPLTVAALVSRYGRAAVPNRAQVADLATTAMVEGTQTRDARAIDQEMDRLGAGLRTVTSDDSSAVMVSSVAPQLPKALAVMADVARAPVFPQAEVDRIRHDQLVALQQLPDDSDAVTGRAMRRELYGPEHPYGVGSVTGDEKMLATISREDLLRFHEQAYSPRTTALVLVGDLTARQARSAAEAAFGDWSGTGGDTVTPGPPRPGAGRMFLVDQPGAAQTTLLLAQPGVSITDPDAEKLDVMDAVLGGGTSSRLFRNLRERHGYTYGADSSVTGMRGIGPITLGAEAQTRFTGASIQEMLNEVNALRDTLVGPEELEVAKESLRRSMPSGFSTVAALASSVGALFVYDLPGDYYQRLPDAYARVSADDVRAVARAHLHPEEMKVFAVGDRSEITPQLAGLGLGPVIALDQSGDRLPAAAGGAH